MVLFLDLDEFKISEDLKNFIGKSSPKNHAAKELNTKGNWNSVYLSDVFFQNSYFQLVLYYISGTQGILIQLIRR